MPVVDPSVFKTLLPKIQKVVPPVVKQINKTGGVPINDGFGTVKPNILQANKQTDIRESVEAPTGGVDQYDFSQYSYPEDLFATDNRYGGSYVVFYVNVQEDSKFAKQNPDQLIPDANANKGLGSRITKNKVSAGRLVATTSGLGALGGTVVGKVLGNSGGGLVGGAVVGGVVGGVVAGTKFSENQDNPKYSISELAGLNVTKQTKRLKTAIALYTPNELNFRYAASWSDDETMLLSAALESSQDITNALKTFGTDDKINITNSVGAIKGLALKAAQAVGPNGLAPLTGTAPNPRKEQFFGGMDFRTHQFVFRFWIRSEQESTSVQNIIKLFKKNMHPSFKDGNEYIFLYPSEFDIQFYNNNEESTELPRLTTCVLSDFSTNYTPSGVRNTLKDGKISEITINMVFKELAILTQDEIDEGY